MLDLTSPFVTDDPEAVKTQVNIHANAYVAAKGTHAIVICTEWDEFVVSLLGLGLDQLRILAGMKKSACHLIGLIQPRFFFKSQTLDYTRMYQSMLKPAFLFDGRKILKHEELMRIGFHVDAIGQKISNGGGRRGSAILDKEYEC